MRTENIDNEFLIVSDTKSNNALCCGLQCLDEIGAYTLGPDPWPLKEGPRSAQFKSDIFYIRGADKET
jgi:hypothetical protein